MVMVMVMEQMGLGMEMKQEQRSLWLRNVEMVVCEEHAKSFFQVRVCDHLLAVLWESVGVISNQQMRMMNKK